MYIPDAYNLWKDHEEEKERWLKRRPICFECGEHIQSDICYEINRKLICKDCLKNSYERCTDDYER